MKPQFTQTLQVPNVIVMCLAPLGRKGEGGRGKKERERGEKGRGVTTL